jgi:uridylate kinase
MAAPVEVLSLGGSIVAPGAVDTGFLRSLYRCLSGYLDANAEQRLVIVVGGGAPARSYQAAYRQTADAYDDAQADWIGIAATRLNAQLLRAIFASYCDDPVVIDPEIVDAMGGRVLIAAGWKPGFSTDFDAVVLAERFGAARVLNLSNIAKVYTADPKADPRARPLDTVSWADFRRIVGDTWVPGKNLPFDPVASRRAEMLHLAVVAAAGNDLGNLIDILEGRSYRGTTIGPG